MSISISKLRKEPVLMERHLNIQRCYRVGGIVMRLELDPIAHDWYLNFIEYGPRCGNTTISLVKTKCHYGGYREWFECPKCLKRAGVLYKDGDNFRCRKCLDLVYESQKVHYRSLEPTIRSLRKMEAMNDEFTWRYYRGKPTKRTVRYEKLRSKVEIGLMTFGPRYTK